MQRQHLEARVINIVEAVRAKRKVEDDRVEIKAEWPTEAAKTARQIAGHANLCGGESILWIVGLDENRSQVGSIREEELANWWPAVKKCFDGVAPELSTLSIPVGPDERVVALQFDTSRAPYVVSVEGGGRVEREVPWREGNATRSARRHELLRSVVEQAQIPELELVSGSINLLQRWGSPSAREKGDHFSIQVDLRIFVSAISEAVVPQHRQAWSLRTNRLPALDLGEVSVRGPFRLGKFGPSGGRAHDSAGYIDVLDQRGLVVRGSGEITASAVLEIEEQQVREIANAAFLDLDIDLPVDRTNRSCRLVMTFRHVTGSEEPEPSEDSLAIHRCLAKFTPQLLETV
ncbi:hypothetical protein ACI2LF_32000 [Kribbella sp. NPDC020789]